MNNPTNHVSLKIGLDVMQSHPLCRNACIWTVHSVRLLQVVFVSCRPFVCWLVEATVLSLTFAARVGSENAATVCAKALSPSSGSSGPVIRVGLSRNARVKPLHAKVSIRST